MIREEESHKHCSSGATTEKAKTWVNWSSSEKIKAWTEREGRHLHNRLLGKALCAGTPVSTLKTPYLLYWSNSFILMLSNYFTAVLLFVLLTSLLSFVWLFLWKPSGLWGKAVYLGKMIHAKTSIFFALTSFFKCQLVSF